MLTDFKVLAPENTLGDAARLILAGSQRDFPVLREAELVGVCWATRRVLAADNRRAVCVSWQTADGEVLAHSHLLDSPTGNEPVKLAR